MLVWLESNSSESFSDIFLSKKKKKEELMEFIWFLAARNIHGVFLAHL